MKQRLRSTIVEMEPKQGSKVSDWYDGFSAQQSKLGINIRHRTILRNASKAGLRDGMHVLEIGCGIGTVTSLLARAVPSGLIHAVDISPKSIAIAREHLKGRRNVEFIVSDMSDFSSSERYDFVVLPDVIEHIPLEQHPSLFSTIARHLKPDARVLINVPNAQLLEHLHKHDPDKLQVIDQPIHLDRLIATVRSAGLVLESLTSYGLQFEHVEYHSIVLRPTFALDRLARKNHWSLMLQELRSHLPW